MAKTKQEIISKIESRMAQYGGSYSDWYVGIAADPKDRLFNNHCVHDLRS